MNDSSLMHPSRVMIQIFVAIVAGPSSLSVAAEPPTAPDGAMRMQEQQQRLDKLITSLPLPWESTRWSA